MKRQYRLRRPTHFQRVRRNGVHHDGAVLSISVAPARQRISRCGIIVARRLGGAVIRNRIKRRIREALRSQYDFIKPHCDIVIVARSRSLTTLPFTRITDVVIILLQRANAWQHDIHPQSDNQR
ncbi:MAG: ribonuclease P protein component [Chloroflexi bacterium]|nr:ribonuclease P protein component [Chloroflexota bacterium]